MEETIYRLHPLSPLHLGEGGYGMEAAGEAVHSDTLFSALCSSLRLVEGQGWLEDLLAAFNGVRRPSSCPRPSPGRASCDSTPGPW